MVSTVRNLGLGGQTAGIDFNPKGLGLPGEWELGVCAVWGLTAHVLWGQWWWMCGPEAWAPTAAALDPVSAPSLLGPGPEYPAPLHGLWCGGGHQRVQAPGTLGFVAEPA